ncbi:MmcQ/YjbR family DNA-binding protein, partial [Vibrio cholerae]
SESYRLVVLGLSQRLQKELGITPRADGESAS